MSKWSKALSSFVTNLQYEDIPEEVIADIRLRVLDILGIAIAGTELAASSATIDMVAEWGGTPQSHIVGTSHRLPMPSAGLANGQLGHSFDFDDTHSASLVHASACIIPAALTLAEGLQLSGKETVVLAAVGYETALRLGLLVQGRLHLRGFHTTSLCGALGVALMGSRALGLSVEETANALGIVTTQASGLLETVKDGSWAKLLNPGWAVHSGIVAAQLAARGFTGAVAALEGEYGFYRSHLGEFDAEAFGELVATLGDEWHTPDIAYKLYPACHHVHAFIDSISHLKREHGLTAEQVESVECRVAAGQVPVVCEPWEPRLAPESEYGARFSLPYAVAVAFVDEHVGIGSFSSARLDDPRLLGLTQKVSYKVNPDVEFPRYLPSWIIVKTRDGQVLEHRLRSCRGQDTEPITAANLEAKFRQTAGRVLAEDAVTELISHCRTLEQKTDISDIFDAAQPWKEAQALRV